MRLCLAVVFAVKHLLGQPFVLYTDHLQLQWLSAQKMEGRLSRWALALYKFDLECPPTQVQMQMLYYAFPLIYTSLPRACSRRCSESTTEQQNTSSDLAISFSTEQANVKSRLEEESLEAICSNFNTAVHN